MFEISNFVKSTGKNDVKFCSRSSKSQYIEYSTYGSVNQILILIEQSEEALFDFMMMK